MTDQDPDRERRLPALGQPPGDIDPADLDQPDFADEHDDTAVAEEILTGEDVDREPEAPRGWSGMDA